MPDGHDELHPLEQALDLCVYAPLGFMLEARSLLPKFIDRGRSQIVLARVVGKYAVKRGNAAAEGVVVRASEQAIGTLRLLGVVPDSPRSHDDDATDEPSVPPRSAPEAAPSHGAGSDGDGSGRAGSNGVDSSGDGEPREDGASTTAETAGAEATAPEPSTAATTERPVPPIDPETLGIPDYDSLSASQVVPRLESLSAAELEDVRIYEHATRGRKTILNRVAQLQSA